MATTLGFIGLGVMGEPMCRNLAKKSSAAVVAFDERAEPLEAVAREGVARGASAADVAARAGPPSPTRRSRVPRRPPATARSASWWAGSQRSSPGSAHSWGAWARR